MWPWGGGTIRLPPRGEITFMPSGPTCRSGTLRAAVSYPAEPERFDDAAVRAALERVDLGHLAPSLDRSDRWDRELSLDEQQRLAFARLLLHAPRWVIVDDALSAVSKSHRRLALSACDRELVGVALVRIGRDPVLDGFWDRTLHIVERPGGPRLRPTLADGDRGACGGGRVGGGAAKPRRPQPAGARSHRTGRPSTTISTVTGPSDRGSTGATTRSPKRRRMPKAWETSRRV